MPHEVFERLVTDPESPRQLSFEVVKENPPAKPIIATGERIDVSNESKLEPIQLAFSQIYSGRSGEEAIYFSADLIERKRLLILRRGRQYMAQVLESETSKVVFETNLCEEIGLAQRGNVTEDINAFTDLIAQRVSSIGDFKILLFNLRNHTKNRPDTHFPEDEGAKAETNTAKIIGHKTFLSPDGHKVGTWMLKEFEDGQIWITISGMVEKKVKMGNGPYKLCLVNGEEQHFHITGLNQTSLLEMLNKACSLTDVFLILQSLIALGMVSKKGHNEDDISNGGHFDFSACDQSDFSRFELEKNYFLRWTNDEGTFLLTVEHWVEDKGYQTIFEINLIHYLLEDREIDWGRRDRFIDLLQSKINSLTSLNTLLSNPGKIAALVAESSGFDDSVEEDDFFGH